MKQNINDDNQFKIYEEKGKYVIYNVYGILQEVCSNYEEAVKKVKLLEIILKNSEANKSR